MSPAAALNWPGPCIHLFFLVRSHQLRSVTLCSSGLVAGLPPPPPPRGSTLVSQLVSACAPLCTSIPAYPVPWE